MQIGGGNEIWFQSGTHRSMRSGETVRFTVLGTHGNNKYLVRIGTRTETIHSKIPLKTGKAYYGQIAERHGETTLPGTERPLAGQTAPARDMVSVIVQEAFMRQGTIPAADTMKKLAGILHRIGKNDLRSARILAMAIEKGIRIDDETALRLLDEVAGTYGLRDDSHDNNEPRDKRREPQSFEKYIRRSCVPKESSEDLLALFNHLACDTENWVIVPYRYGQDDKDEGLTGTIRLKIDGKTGKIGVILLEAEYESARWVFMTDMNKNKPFPCKILCSSEADAGIGMKLFKNFEEKLQNIGIKIVDSIIECGETDGFGFPAEKLYGSIDRLA